MHSIIGRKIYSLIFSSLFGIVLITTLTFFSISHLYIHRSISNRIQGTLNSIKIFLDNMDFSRLTDKVSNEYLLLRSNLPKLEQEMGVLKIHLIVPGKNNFFYISSSDFITMENIPEKALNIYKLQKKYEQTDFVLSNINIRTAYMPYFDRSGNIRAIIRADFNLTSHKRALYFLTFSLPIIFLLTLAVTLLLKAFFNRSYVMPVLELSRGAKIIASGNLEYKLKINSKDEIGELSMDFNKMTHNLRESFDKIENYSKNLLIQLYTDPLTNLPNRKKFLEDLIVTPYPVIIIFNIDSFQEINDFYGNEIGDLILKQLSERLSNTKFDTPFRLYKMHADEFVMLISQKVSEKQMEEWGSFFSDEIMAKPFNFNDTEIYITTSLGIGNSIIEESYPEKGKDALRNADMALKIAKRSRKKYVVYKESMNTIKEYENNILWTRKLKSAIVEDRIIPYFQPIFNNRNGKIEKYECLVRLKESNGNIISPFYFLEIAKKARLYRYITKIMIEKCFNFFKDMDFEFSINICLDDIMDEKTIAFIYELLKIHKSIAAKTAFELLETENMEAYREVKEFIDEVKNFGCKIAIDDFGTGYSNFSHIIHLNIDYIKIDASLIKNIHEDKNAQVITQTITTFAKELGLKTISEFVHSKEVFEKVLEIGIDFSQGFFLGEPREKI